jgi:intein/homing endonuclease
MQVRTGKTLTSLEVAKLYGAQNVLFLTKKKAISSIEKDYADFGYSFQLTVVNDESMHKLDNPYQYDLVVHDEHHRCFLGTTLIDGVEIKNINVGDSKKSFNFDKKCYEYKKVNNIFKNKLTDGLVKIKCNGKEIICTKSHEIFTKRGWIKAKDILPTDDLQVV